MCFVCICPNCAPNGNLSFTYNLPSPIRHAKYMLCQVCALWIPRSARLADAWLATTLGSAHFVQKHCVFHCARRSETRPAAPVGHFIIVLLKKNRTLPRGPIEEMEDMFRGHPTVGMIFLSAAPEETNSSDVLI